MYLFVHLFVGSSSISSFFHAFMQPVALSGLKLMSNLELHRWHSQHWDVCVTGGWTTEVYAKAAPHARGQVFGQVRSPALSQSLPTCHIIANVAGARSNLLCVAANQARLCYLHVILQLLPSVKHVLKLGTKVSLVCCGTTKTAVLHARHPAVAAFCTHIQRSDIGRALLPMKLAIKAAQLTIVTIFLDIAFSTCDTNHVAHST